MRKHFRFGAMLAGAVLAALAFALQAAGLGKLTLLSALGQPLQAEIDLIAVPKDELPSVTARVAPPETYRDAGVEYLSGVANIKFTVEKRASGQAYLRLSSPQPVNEPFLELLVEVSWPTGKLLRQYPVLLDPPTYIAERPITAPQVAARSPGKPTVAAAGQTPVKPAPNSASAASEARPPTGVPSAAPGATGSTASDTYGPIKRGETLSRIATALRPQGVAMEQMLVALYRENTGAFIGKNMNLLKTGQMLRVPEAAEAAKISPNDAQKQIRVQTASWADYRQRLAAAVAKAPAKKTVAGQTTRGGVSARAQDGAAASGAAQDVLDVSKGQAPEKSAGASGSRSAKAAQQRIQSLEEEAVARENLLKESSSRVAELEKQVKQMRELLALKGATPAQPEQSKSAQPEQSKSAQPTAPESAQPTPPESAQPAPAEPGPAPSAIEPQPQPAPPPTPDATTEKPRAVVAKPQPMEEPSFVESLLDRGGSMVSSLMENPLYLGAGVVVIGLAGVLGATAARRKRERQLGAFTATGVGGSGSASDAAAARAADSAILGATTSGKQSGLVETSESAFLSEFNKVTPGTAENDDVDPVAEADVYMAYGRDAQAEEILKEAMQRDKQRHEIPFKLLEIYAARRSVGAFEAVAKQLLGQIGANHPLWAKVAEMGRDLDSGNELYAGVDAPTEDSAATKTNVVSFPSERSNLAFTDLAIPDTKPSKAEADPLDLDLGLGASGSAPMPQESLPAGAAKASADMLDFDLTMPATAARPVDPATPSAESQKTGNGADPFVLDFELDKGDAAATNDLSFDFDGGDAKLDEEAEALDLSFDLEPEKNDAAKASSEATSSGVGASLGRGSLVKAPLNLSEINLDLDKPTLPAEDRGLAASTNAGKADGESGMWRTAATKLDLARAYLELGDKDGAKEIIDEVIKEGTPAQQQEARKLAASM